MTVYLIEEYSTRSSHWVPLVEQPSVYIPWITFMGSTNKAEAARQLDRAKNRYQNKTLRVRGYKRAPVR